MIGLAPHRLPESDFVQLAAGSGNPAVIRRLRRAGRSRTLLAMGFVATETARLGHPDAQLVARACRVLSEVHEQSKGAVRKVLEEPEVAVWAIGAARELVHGGTRFPPSAVANVAAAAAVRAGVSTDLTMASGSSTPLPSLGTVDRGGQRVHIRADTEGCVFRADGHPVRLSAPFHAPGPEWSPLVRVSLGLKTITLDRWALGSLPRPFMEELLPDDDCDGSAWSRVLSEGIDLLRRHGTAEVVIETVRTITPLRQAGTEPAGATLADAFGCVLLSRPHDARAAALALAHEVQHAKLTVLLNLFPLLDTTPRERFYAPWRRDPRPLLGLLHGAYAYVGVIGFWERQRGMETDPSQVLRAEVELARWLVATTETVSLLATRRELTEHGREFVAHLSKTLAELSRNPVSPSASAEAERLRLAHRNRWAGR